MGEALIRPQWCCVGQCRFQVESDSEATNVTTLVLQADAPTTGSRGGPSAAQNIASSYLIIKVET